MMKTTMKTLPSVICGFLLSAGALGAHAADDGNVWEFTPTANTVAATEPLDAGNTIEFKLRLLSPSYGKPEEWLVPANRHRWEIYSKVSYASAEDERIAWIANPLMLGIVVSGQTRGAIISFPGPLSTYGIQDIDCSYPIAYGDFALPVRLAADGSGMPVGDGTSVDPAHPFDAKTDCRYFFVNSNLWGIRDAEAFAKDGTIIELNPWRRSAGPETGSTRNGSYDLAFDFDEGGKAFFIKTVSFDPDGTFVKDGETYWAGVHENSISTIQTSGDTKLVVSGNPPADVNGLKMYVWSEDEDVAFVYDGVKTPFYKPNGTLLCERYVKAIQILPGKDGTTDRSYSFMIKGGASGRGQSTRFVMSAQPGYSYRGNGDQIENYIVAKVYCDEPEKPTVTVSITPSELKATPAYGETYDAKLTISLNQPNPDADVVVTLTNTFTEADYEGNPFDYVYYSENTSVDDFADPSYPTVTFKKGSTDADIRTIYVYALRSDAHVRLKSAKLKFDVNPADAATAAFLQGTDSSSVTIVSDGPVIAAPTENETMKAIATVNVPYSVPVVVAGTYADEASKEGFLIEYSFDNGATWTECEGRYKTGEGNYLYLTNTVDVPPQVIFKKASVSDYSTLTLRLTAPVSQKKSELRTVNVRAKGANAVTLTPFDEDGKECYEFSEGQSVSFTATIDNEDGKADKCYLYLMPMGSYAADFDADYIVNTNAGATTAIGLELPNSSFIEISDAFDLLDGTANKGTAYNFRVVICSSSTYDEENVVAGFETAQFKANIRSKNVVPTVTYAQVKTRTNRATKSGDTIKKMFPMNISQEITLGVNEPGENDKKATGTDAFEVYMMFEDADGNQYGPMDPENPGSYLQEGVVAGNPDDFKVNFDFPNAGRWMVTVMLKDKDMADFPDSEEGWFVFYVNVIDQPSIEIIPNYTLATDRFYEDETEATFNIQLALNNYTQAIKARMTVRPENTTDENPGKFVLKEKTSTDGSIVDLGNDEYEVTFNAHRTNLVVQVKSMDGTPVSKSEGFNVSVKMQGNDPTVKDPDSGKTPEEYYSDGEAAIKVQNQAPIIEEGDLIPEPSTNVIKVAIGTVDQAITWVISDVKLDFEGFLKDGVTHKGVSVKIFGDDGEGIDKTYYTKADANLAGKTGYQPKFNSSGTYTVTMIVKDYDNGSATYREQAMKWYYQVEIAKGLTLVPNGPTTGNGTALSKKYAAAAGIGEGRVWAGGLSSCTNQVSVFNCKLATTWQIYAYGYKVNDIDNGLIGGYHYPDQRTGYYSGRTSKTNWEYKDAERDSFLYAWVQVLRDESSAALTDTLLNGSTSPEYTEKISNGQTIALPTEAAEDGTFVDTIAEAIFSKEVLPSDNMGDINWDYIPDVFYDKYDFQVESETGTTTAADGTSSSSTTIGTASDLAKLGDYNSDEDYLPAELTAVSTLIDDSTSNAIPFTARMEIRGFGDTFNDATASVLPDGTPNPCGIVGVKPDKCYKKGDKCTLTEVEYLAWLEFAAAKGLDADNEGNWDLWSPERPSDPTLADTDGDGFDDGYEYFYWYRAHVGYLDEQGHHRHLTGRRFNPRNPGKGDFISSEEIEKIMDPLVFLSVDARIQDSDNDGLTDIEEFTLGTNPFDFDSDGDGLPDGWELFVSNTNPRFDQNDAGKNNDGDAMALTSPKLEAAVMPAPFVIQKFTTFAVIDPEGDTDGVQWYATKDASVLEFDEPIETAPEYNVVTIKNGDKPFMVATKLAIPVVETAPGKKCLAVALQKADAAKAPITYLVIDDTLLLPVTVPAGSEIVGEVETDKALKMIKVKTAVDADKLNAAWVYGADKNLDAERGEFPATAAGFGCLALARPKGVAEGAQVCWLASEEIDVAYLHYLVYQEFGFDPRTAWHDKSPLASRWSARTSDGQAVSGVYQVKQGGFANYATRTVPYSNYDEFLVMSFFLNNGTLDGADDAWPVAGKNPWVTIWTKYTTNPRGPADVEVADADTENGANAKFTADGADTDLDGVPDGWELYVMAGPKKNGAYNFAPPYDGFETAFNGVTSKSFWSPFVPAANTADTTSQIYLGGQANMDDLSELREFSGTDSCAAYTNVCTTILPRTQQVPSPNNVYTVDDSKWLNKFFPTDPWNVDTDGDGVSDSDEKTFIYGNPVDNAVLWSIPGAGLNPCSVDTDLDGIPDGWEKQFAGKGDASETSIYAGEDATYAAGLDKGVGNPLEGLTDGMDGTVPDSYNVPPHTITITSDGRHWSGHVNRDYDHDGLENWQEYMTGTMRCWRYDDPYSMWSYIPHAAYYVTNEEGKEVFSAAHAAAELGCDVSAEDEGVGEFWYKTLVDKTSPIYNPRLVTDRATSGMYFSRVTNGWDTAFIDYQLGGNLPGAYYYFSHRIGGDKIDVLWKDPMSAFDDLNPSPARYISCSPLKADSDQDGMDDYYELFHGMNPLLGEAGVAAYTEGPCDLVYDAWYKRGTTPAFSAVNNVWRTKDERFDFVKFPWLNGMASADPDGDDIRTQEEALMPELATTTWHHTDPTPLWMTDSSYTNSLTRMFWRMPARGEKVELEGDTFTFDEKEHRFSDYDAFVPAQGLDPAYFGAFAPDQWSVFAANKDNWMFSFEENEGFDSDHDGISDYEELQGKFGSGSDPQNADSPHRRQAMYFQGPAKPSILQSMPYVKENYPVLAKAYPDDLSFLQYTVECWVRPTSLANATILERAVRVASSKVGDEEYIRSNFQLGIRDGKWYTKFDPRGTLANNQVEVFSAGAATMEKWTHLAATYDGQNLTLYVDGVAEIPKVSGLQPAYGSQAVATEDTSYLFDTEYDLTALIIGARVKKQAELPEDFGKALDVTAGRGFGDYADFYEGYVDEVRIWDGVRTLTQIQNNMKVRFTRAMAIENRNEFYDQWAAGKRRYGKDGEGQDNDVIAELRYHYAFDSIFGADNDTYIGKTPHGFGTAGSAVPAPFPVDYGIAWWMKVLAGYADTVYNDSAWVTWVPNTVTHLPRFDGSTYDSFYWSDDFKGATAGTYSFAHTNEVVSLWKQVSLNALEPESKGFRYASTGTRHHLMNMSEGSNFALLYEFAGRHLHQSGDDLVPLGGAFARYCDKDVGLWDNQGPSTMWEVGCDDSDGDGLPDWWEEYAQENYAWDSKIVYNDIMMTAGEAYLRDLAKGFYIDAFGRPIDNSTKYRQVADENANGLPDWWENMYGIYGVNPLADNDNDGLPNYVEYLLSEVFQFKGLMFSPVKACSVDPYTPDYFFKIGSLYAGEIFTDHDMVDDAWEDTYATLNDKLTPYATRLAYDAFADADEDGWSNRSECRYAKQSLAIVANQQTHQTAVDGLVADYPIPTISLKLRYNGAKLESVRGSALVVKTMTRTNVVDATFEIAAAGAKTAGTGQSSDKNEKTATVSYTRNLGRWSNRHVIGTLTPGNIAINSLDLQFTSDPSSTILNWQVYSPEWGYSRLRRGSQIEYDTDRRKYGEGNVVLLSTIDSYNHLEGVSLTADEATGLATWKHLKSGLKLGTVNLMTGAFDIDFTVLKGVYTVSTNGTDLASMEDLAYRIAYNANDSINLPRELYLGQTHTKSGGSAGYIREGKNTIIAWADINDNGEHDVDEPYGIVNDVDVSWCGTSAEIELTDISPVTPRIALWNDAADRSDTRESLYTRLHEIIGASYLSPAAQQAAEERLKWIENNPIGDASVYLSSSEPVRVRVVRWLVDGLPVYSAGVNARVVYDRYHTLANSSTFTEANLLNGETLDLDWDKFQDEVVEWPGTAQAGLSITNVSYLVVIGEGETDWRDMNSTNVTVYALNQMVTRYYGANRVLPEPVTPGTAEGTVYTANPTFRWKLDVPEREGYTAFRLQVTNGVGKVIYDSDVLPAPARDTAGVYTWPAPLYVGDKTLKGEVFANESRYGWRVSMMNAKYKDPSYSKTPASFYMHMQTNGFETGSAHVSVRYTGPAASYAGKVIRVRAYTSPDFTGQPVAAGFVANPDDAVSGVGVTYRAPVENCTIIGIPRGKYYLQAFIDSNANGFCDLWETQGYFSTRDGSSPDYLDPQAITYADQYGYGDLAVIYLEDADTDRDGLPDAWEWATYGSLTAKGVEYLSETAAGEFVVNPALTGELKLKEDAFVPTAGIAGRILSTLNSAGTLALALGAPAQDYPSFAAAISGAVSEELAEDGVKIGSLTLVEGKMSITVAAKTEVSSSDSVLAPAVATAKPLNVRCYISTTTSLTAPWSTWQYVDTIEVGAGAQEIDVSGFVPSGDGVFVKIKLEK